MSGPDLRILVADDHELIREGLRHALQKAYPGLEVIEVAKGGDVLPALRVTRVDVVVLDLAMPDRNGIDVLKDLKSEFASLPVLVLSIYPEEEFALRLIRAGADGYLNKATATKHLRQAVQTVRDGGRHISDQVAQQLMQSVRKPSDRLLHERLSNRQDQVFRLLASGKRVGEIADHLELSVKTVSTYRAQILEKLTLENNAQLMRYAHDHGLTIDRGPPGPR